ncbi:hypothetical protein D9M69_540160 [compost metagenome]
MSQLTADVREVLERQFRMIPLLEKCCFAVGGQQAELFLNLINTWLGEVIGMTSYQGGTLCFQCRLSQEIQRYFLVVDFRADHVALMCLLSISQRRRCGGFYNSEFLGDDDGFIKFFDAVLSAALQLLTQCFEFVLKYLLF